MSAITLQESLAQTTADPTLEFLTMKRQTYLILIIAAVLSGCGLVPDKVSYDDPKLQPFWKAVASVDRASLGFTPVSRAAKIRLERGHGHYDAMLHIYQATSRTIAFKAVDGGYKWIGEQESHQGPRKYTTVDGTFNEQIVITYDTVRVSGAPLNQIYIQYFGEDSRLTHRRDLTLNYVRPIIEEWDILNRKDN